MDLIELKHITAANLIKLRGDAGLTQAELGAKLNYSDKTISKWERGEAIPDAFVLKQLSQLYSVTVDQLLSPMESWEEKTPAAEENPAEISSRRLYSEWVVIAISMLSVWTAALIIFVAAWLCDVILWQIFLICLPVSLIILLVLICVFKRGKMLQYVISALVLSIFVVLYYVLPLKNPWQIFLICIPGIAIVFLACNVKRRPTLKQIKEKVIGPSKNGTEPETEKE